MSIRKNLLRLGWVLATPPGSTNVGNDLKVGDLMFEREPREKGRGYVETFFVGPRSVCGVTGTLCLGLRVHGFQSQGGSIITCALLSLARNVPQNHPRLPGLGIGPGSLTPEASTIPLRQPDPVVWKNFRDGYTKEL